LLVASGIQPRLVNEPGLRASLVNGQPILDCISHQLSIAAGVQPSPINERGISVSLVQRQPVFDRILRQLPVTPGYLKGTSNVVPTQELVYVEMFGAKNSHICRTANFNSKGAGTSRLKRAHAKVSANYSDGTGKAVRQTLLKYKLHQDQELFDRTYAYIREYY
jgi:hypothetical protein